jgi:hypothetical protein
MRVNRIERRVEGQYGIVQVAISLASFGRKRVHGGGAELGVEGKME